MSNVLGDAFKSIPKAVQQLLQLFRSCNEPLAVFSWGPRQRNGWNQWLTLIIHKHAVWSTGEALNLNYGKCHVWLFCWRDGSVLAPPTYPHPLSLRPARTILCIHAVLGHRQGHYFRLLVLTGPPLPSFTHPYSCHGPHPIAQTCLFSSQLPLPRIFPTTSGPLVCFRVQKLVFRHHNRFIFRALQRHNWPSVRVGGQGLLPGLFWGAVHWGAAGGQALPVWTAVLVVKVQFESAATMGRHCPSKPAQGPSQLSIRDSSWSATPGTKKKK